MVLVRCPHTGTIMHAAVTSWYATETVKTAHIKAKDHTFPSSYTQFCACMHNKLTQRDRFTLSAHFFWDTHRTKIHKDHSPNHYNFKTKIKNDENHSAQHPQMIPGGSKHNNKKKFNHPNKMQMNYKTVETEL